MTDNEKALPQTKFTVTNFNEAYSLNCNANNDLLTADTLATLIRDLSEKGVINNNAAVS